MKNLMAKHGLKTSEPPKVDHDGTIFRKYKMLEYSKERRDDYDNSVGLIKSQTVPGNKDLIEVVKFAMQRTLVIIQKYPLFELPTELDDETLGYLLS